MGPSNNPDQSCTSTPAKALPQALLAHWARILQLCLGQSEQAVADMLQALAALGAHVAAAPDGTDRLARLYEGLQYQDRQRQTLELLLADVHAARSLSAEQAATLDIHSWLDQFEANCPIPELRRHKPMPPASVDAGADTGLDYF